MSAENTPTKAAVPPEKERTFVYSLARFLAAILTHTIYPARYEHRENFDLQGPYIILSNHNSALDPIFLGYPCKKYEIRFVGKKELVQKKWIARVLNDGLHMITVDRHNSDLAAMRQCARALRDGYVLGIFPEGTRHQKELMSEVESGAAVLALRSKVPLLPVYLASAPRLFRMNRVLIGRPIDYADLIARGFDAETVDLLCGRIRDTFRSMRDEAQKQ